MKKIVTLLLTAVMAASLLSGCGQSGNTAPAASAPAASAPAAEQKLTGTVATDGSTSMEKVIGALGEAFEADNSGVTFTYNPPGSGSGIKAVAEGRCDIGLSSRGLKDEEKAKGLTGTVLALDGIAIIVHPDNPVADLDLDTIAKIYTGEISNWSEVGGNDVEIVLIGREAGSGTRDGFESITKTKDKCKLAQELTSTGAVIEAVKNSEAAIGYASFAAVANQKGIKVLKINGFECTEENILAGKYVIQRPFNLITKEGTPLSEISQKFFDFMVSKNAADMITKAGAVPTAK